MTPVGRPPRSSSPSLKSVSTRCTLDEWHAWKNADPSMYLSDWVRDQCNQAVGRPRAPIFPVDESALAESMAQVYESARVFGERVAAGAEITPWQAAGLWPLVESMLALIRAQEVEREGILVQLKLCEGIARMEARLASASKGPDKPEPGTDET